MFSTELCAVHIVLDDIVVIVDVVVSQFFRGHFHFYYSPYGVNSGSLEGSGSGESTTRPETRILLTRNYSPSPNNARETR